MVDWLPSYDHNKAISDFIAGIAVGLTVIPQGIAYALVAELPPKVSSEALSVTMLSYILLCCSLDSTLLLWDASCMPFLEAAKM